MRTLREWKQAVAVMMSAAVLASGFGAGALASPPVTGAPNLPGIPAESKPPVAPPPATPAGTPIEIPIKDVAPRTLTDEQVVASLTKGIEFIFSKQQPDGGWEDSVFQHDGRVYSGGNTAVVLYTLLHVGQSLRDPRLTSKSKELQKAIALVKNIKTDLVYLKAMQLMALSEIKGTPEDTRALSAMGRQLLTSMSPEGGYVYKFSEGPLLAAQKRWDNSATQMALLAAWGMSENKVEIPVAYWRMHDKFWRGKQNADGGWGYGSYRADWLKSWQSMTAAGVASLFVLNEQLRPSVALTAIPDKALESGLEWMDKNVDAGGVFNTVGSGYFMLYSIERASLAAGRKYIGGKDWYRDGAAALMKRQQPNGGFPMHYWFHDTGGGIVPTCYALMFLARGRNPVAFSKLQYPGKTWNARAYDLANLTRWMGGQFERAINWQTVSFANDPEEWLDSPVLLITGSQDPKFTEEQVSKLRRYVELGGTIFSTTDGGGLAFTNAMKQYAAKIVDKKHAMRDIPQGHPIYSAWGKLVHPMRLMGMSNGLREVWVHSPGDLGSAWQRRAYAQTDQWTMPANVYFYAAGATETLLPRLKSLRVDDAAGDTVAKVTLGRLEHAGNWDPEPGAWGRFAKVMRRDAKAAVEVVAVKASELDATRTPVVHLTGTGELSLSSEAIERLKAFIEKGGTLLIDNATGEKAFTEAVNRLVASLGLGEMNLLAENDAVYQGAFSGGSKIEELAFRKSAKVQGLTNARDLLGAKKGERWAVIYAPENVTSGLLGTNTLGIVGYEADSALALARNMVLYGGSAK